MSEEDPENHLSHGFASQIQLNTEIRPSVASSNVRRNIPPIVTDSPQQNTTPAPTQRPDEQNGTVTLQTTNTNIELHLSSASSDVRLDREHPVTAATSRTLSLLNLGAPNTEDTRPIPEPSGPSTALSPAQTKIRPAARSSIYFTRPVGSVYLKPSFSRSVILFDRTRKVRSEMLRAAADMLSEKSLRSKNRSGLMVWAKRSKIQQIRSLASTPEIRSFDSPPVNRSESRRRKFVPNQRQSWGFCRPGVAILSVAVLTLLLRVNPCVVCAIILLNPFGYENRKHGHWVATYGPCVLFIQAIFVSGVCILLLSVVFGKHPKLIIPFIFVQLVSISFWLFVIVYFLTCIPEDNSITGIAILTSVGVFYDVAATIITTTAYLDLYGYRRENFTIKVYFTFYTYISRLAYWKRPT